MVSAQGGLGFGVPRPGFVGPCDKKMSFLPE